MTFVFDENLSPRHAARLRDLSHDAVAISEVGLSGASDPAVRAFAIGTGRVLITMDADFGNVLRYPAAGTPGVVLAETSSANGSVHRGGRGPVSGKNSERKI